MKNKYYYLAVTNDEYEFPLFVADNYEELSKFSGRSIACLKQSVCRHLLDKTINCYYIKVSRIDEMENELCLD